MIGASEVTPPPHYTAWRRAASIVIAWDPVADAVRAALEEAATLHEWAAGKPEHAAQTGRGVVYARRLGPELAAVRRGLRGGWMAPLLGDRYFGVVRRPFRELAVSVEARERGVPTPRVLAAIVHPARPGYRGEVATSWLTPGHDLFSLLRPGAYTDEDRSSALEAVGETLAITARAGLLHPDLNLSNIFVGPATGSGWRALILDLDRARIQRTETFPLKLGVDRLLRSIEKARRNGRVTWTSADAEALDIGIRHRR